MTKQEFLTKLRQQLWALPWEDAQRSVDFYTEMIDERMDEGLSEEAAVAAVGDLDEIVKQILQETPRPPAAPQPPKQQKAQQSNWKIWVVILLILGSPLWISLAASVLSIVASVYISLWTIVIVLYAVAVAVAAAAIGCIVASFFMIGRFGTILVTLGAAALCAGLAIVLFLLGNLAAKGMIALTKLCWQGVKSLFSRKERTV